MSESYKEFPHDTVIKEPRIGVWHTRPSGSSVYGSGRKFIISRTHTLAEYDCNWQMSRASETLSGVTQLKIGDICLFIYMCGRAYVILYFDPLIFSS